MGFDGHEAVRRTRSILFGMEQMPDSLKAVTGDRMKDIPAKLTANRFISLLASVKIHAGRSIGKSIDLASAAQLIAGNQATSRDTKAAAKNFFYHQFPLLEDNSHHQDQYDQKQNSHDATRSHEIRHAITTRPHD